MPILECDNLTKRFGSVEALTDVSFSVEPGRIVGLLGPNGSGKTTMIKLINGLLTPTSGQVLIDGEAPGKRSHSLVSYLPDRSCLPQWMTAQQLLDFYRDFYPDFREDAAREMLSRLEIPEKRRMKQLSKGTREKVQLILVMSRGPGSTCWMSPSVGWTPPRETTFCRLSSGTITLRPASFCPPTSSRMWKRCWTTFSSSIRDTSCCVPPWTRSGRRRA